jgi:cation diffusion facilitator CzcD-associated flavoprotein CzcO
MYAPGAEIQRYLQDTAERFGATRFIKTQHRVDRCEYLADEKKWYGLPCYDIQVKKVD